MLTVRDVNKSLLSECELLALVHVAWQNWLRIRKDLYQQLEVNNAEELINKIVDVHSCKVHEKELKKLLQAIKQVIKKGIDKARTDVRELKELGVRIIPFFSQSYPRELLKYPSQGSDYIYPPLVLYSTYAQFNLNKKPIIAVVGTRKCDYKGRKCAYEIGRLIAHKDFILATGLAQGIDVEAAKGCLEAGGQVVGIRPWLLPESLPLEAKRLLKPAVKDNLMLLSERPWKLIESDVKRLYFLRNRIIAGMAKLVIVVEAQLEGGSMHQIKLALRRGKPVAIYKPDEGTLYWNAYKRYVTEGAVPFTTLDQLDTIVENAA